MHVGTVFIVAAVGVLALVALAIKLAAKHSKASMGISTLIILFVVRFTAPQVEIGEFITGMCMAMVVIFLGWLFLHRTEIGRKCKAWLLTPIQLSSQEEREGL